MARAIHLAQLDKIRPALVLTRESVRPRLHWVTVAPITSRVRGISTEVSVGGRNGLDLESVVSLDNVQTILAEQLGRHIGWLQADQEPALAAAVQAAFDLDDLR